MCITDEDDWSNEVISRAQIHARFVSVHVNCLAFQTNNMCLFIYSSQFALTTPCQSQPNYSLCCAFGFSKTRDLFAHYLRVETPVQCSEVLNYMCFYYYF